VPVRIRGDRELTIAVVGEQSVIWQKAVVPIAINAIAAVSVSGSRTSLTDSGSKYGVIGKLQSRTVVG